MSPKYYLVLLTLLLATILAAAAAATSPQTHHIYEEARVVYLGNLARQDNGLPPLRWNRQLTAAGRWFSWDSVANRPDPYCGHQDTNSEWPGDRALAFGYLGAAGAENAFCGYVTPQQAIDGWMDSPGHRANLLGDGHREVGIGYYQRSSDGRGYVTQGFGADIDFPPVIINNEALQTTTPDVDLYIYDRASGGGFAEMGPATQMKVVSDPCFATADWQPFTSELSWSLAAGSGWRDVHVMTTDSLGRTVTVSDTIYLGSTLPVQELALGQAATTTDEITLYGLDGGGLDHVQLSPGWAVDDTYGTFTLHWGNGGRINDGDALGGTAFRLQPGAGESFAWVYTTEFVRDVPLVAYVRLKTSSNVSAAEVARLVVDGARVDGSDYPTHIIRGTDFAAADTYQEFALPFTYHTNSEDPFLIFKFWRSGAADIAIDAVTIFTADQILTSPLTWSVPGGNYRGRGVWVRYTDGAGVFTAYTEAATQPQSLSATPAEATLLAETGSSASTSRGITIHAGCGAASWQVAGSPDWLHWQPAPGGLTLWADPVGLAAGEYAGTLTLQSTGSEMLATVSIRLVVAADLHMTYLPAVQRP